MIRLTVEETNLLSIYNEDGKRGLILACISGAVGIYAMQLYLYSGAAHLEQSYPLLIAMAVIVVLVMVIYGVAVARTANREIGKLNYKPNS